ncbi:MAG: hypothetical protein LBM27_06265, partial [Lactobacillaceae bacterium]|nr:hypothetical protein [Lactobacillaceae bacterium]
NKNEGWASFWVDAAFIAGGLALTVFSGGAALPLVLGGAAVAFNAADLAEDLDKAHYGKNQGFNLIRDGIYKNTFHLSSKDSKNLYTVTHFASDVASGGAFKDLAKSGIWVSKSQAVPLFKTAMKDFTQNGWKSGAKTLARTGISNSKYVLKNKGLAEGIIPRMNPIIKSELFGLTKKEASKQIARSFVRDAVKQKTVDQAKKWGAEQLTSAAQKAVGTNDKTDRKSQVINKLVQKGVGKAVGFADKKLIKSKSLISGTFRAVDNYHERDANGYISSKNEDLKILVTSIKRERAAN